MGNSAKHFSRTIYARAIEPRASQPDARRREFILNVLLTSLLVLASVALVLTVLNMTIILRHDYHSDSLWSTLIFWGLIVFLQALSRYGFRGLASGLFFGLLVASGALFALRWGAGLAVAELMFAFTIVVAGVLFKAARALVAALLVVSVMLTVALLQVHGVQHPNTYWQDEDFKFVDSIGFIAIFVAMGVVSWLSNRETDRSLKRARASEKALQLQRDLLEEKVAERTRQLEELQLARLLELQPFAEFGRIGASLLHDIANPLSAANLNLEELDKQQHSILVHQVRRSLGQLEAYLASARRQIKGESEIKTFSVGTEIRRVVRLMQHRARRAEVALHLEVVPGIKLRGDVVKFNRLVANLVANAIDVSESVPDLTWRRVEISARAERTQAIIEIKDYGPGVPATQVEHIFEPFYSTKKDSRDRGLGLGLAMVKGYVEKDFGGQVQVICPDGGTIFKVILRNQAK